MILTAPTRLRIWGSGVRISPGAPIKSGISTKRRANRTGPKAGGAGGLGRGRSTERTWQNAYVERPIGSIRRECLDHMVVFGQAHLRRILGAYAAYYNESRIHRSLNKDAPCHRAIERLGAITSYPILGGLHHQYCRI